MQPSTFTVRFGDVPLSAQAFTVITYQGKILHPTVTSAAGGPLPASLPGRQDGEPQADHAAARG